MATEPQTDTVEQEVKQTAVVEEESEVVFHSRNVDDYGPLALGAVSTVFAWATVSAPLIGQRSLTGYDTDTGLIVLLVSLGLIGATYASVKHLGKLRAIGGGVILLFAVGQWWWNGQIANQMTQQTAGTMFEGSVQVSTGLGLFLALAAGAWLLYVQYQRKQMGAVSE